MRPEEKELMEYMSELSERAYCAAWMEGLEYALWKATLKGRLKYGWLQITRKHVAKLKELSERCGGWIVWDETLGVRWMPLESWQKMYESPRELAS